jgi:hypothetical protein
MSVPVVPLSSFSNLAGSSLAEDLRRLVVNPGYVALVLFSDGLGEQLAILPVGQGQVYARLEDVNGAEIEGLRPLCALRLRGAEVGPEPKDDARERELARIEESLKVRERFVVECERKMAELGQSLSEREAMMEQREQMLIEKEREFFRRSGEATRQMAKS